jgi:NADPH2:quinone reductase
MRAIRHHRLGGPEVLELDDVDTPLPGPGQALVRVHAAGVNFLDTYLRSGLYDPGPLPARVGGEGAGVVEAVGDGVHDVQVGHRVAFFDAKGAYADAVVQRTERLLALPDGLSFLEGAALPLQGMTAHYLTQTIQPLTPGDRVLIHAAAGGVGLLAVQMAKQVGAEVFATCSTPAKAERASAAGADHVILYTETDFAAEVLRLTGGHGVDLTLDGVGRTTLLGSVKATRVRGHVVLFGQSSGLPEPVQIRPFLGSRTLTSASLFDYTRSTAELQSRARDVFGWAEEGWLQVTVDRVLPLADAALAHRLLESRATSGKLLLRV